MCEWKTHVALHGATGTTAGVGLLGEVSGVNHLLLLHFEGLRNNGPAMASWAVV